MQNQRILVAATLIGLFGLAGNLRADRETATVESAAEVLAAQATIPERCIPPGLLREAQGIAIVPGVVKAGFVIGGRHGRGVILVREPDGGWSNPVFVTMSGASIGWQIGVQSTDVVLIFKTRASLNRIMEGKGKVTLGADAAVAAGPIGRQAEAGTDAALKAEIYSYSRSRGLFAGVSLEGAGILVDYEGDQAFYRIRGGRPADVLAFRGPVPVAVHALRVELGKMTALPPGPPVEVRPIPLPAPTPLPPAPAPVPQNPPPK